MNILINTLLLCFGPLTVLAQQRPIKLQSNAPAGVSIGSLTTGDSAVEEIPDFSQAEEQPDGSLCVIKVRNVQKMEKQQIKECWHQNVKACHDTYVTEFKAMQEKKCDDNTFWKTCKITFHEVALNYTVKTCFKQLVKKCEEGYGNPKEICRTWFETQCNTTFVQTQGDEYHDKHVKDVKASTWCEKVPKKICAPENCVYIPGPEECHDKTIASTIVKPQENCDLQPTTDCQIVTNLVPHLMRRNICEDVPKEFCHTKLDTPRLVNKPVTMKWCTYPNGEQKPNQAAFNVQLINPEDEEPAPPNLSLAGLTEELQGRNRRNQGNRGTRALNQTENN